MATGQLSTVLSKIRRLVVPSATGDDDAHLLDRFSRERDDNAFAELMRRHSPLVMSVCRRVLNNSQDAEDAYQATFLVLVRKAPSLKREGSLASYLHTVAYHLALKIRAQSLKRHCQGEIETVAAKPLNQESMQADIKPVLDEEVHRLPEKYRTPFILCYLEGKTNAEAAEQLGCPQGTIFTRLSRARDMLRARLERRGLALTSAVLASLYTVQTGSAAVSTTLFDSTLKAAVLYKTGSALTSVGASATAAAAAKSALVDMTVSKIKTAAIVLLGISVVGSGIGVATTGALSHWQSSGDNVVVAQDDRQDSVNMNSPTKRVPRQKNHVNRANGKPHAPIRNMQLGRVDAMALDGQMMASADPSSITLVHKGSAKRIPMPKQAKAVGFLKQGKQLAALGDDRVVRICDVESAKEVRQFRVNVPAVRFAVFSNDGTRLAVTGSDDRVHLWDTADGSETVKLPSSSRRILGVAFSPDGHHLAIVSKDSVIVRDLAGKAEVFRHAADGRSFRQPVFSADSKLLAFVDDEGVAVADLHDGQVRHFTGDVSDINAMAFSPEGDRIALREGMRTIRVWDLKCSKEIRTFDLPTGAKGVLTFSRDGKLLHSGGCSFSVEAGGTDGD